MLGFFVSEIEQITAYYYEVLYCGYKKGWQWPTFFHPL